MKRTLRRLHHSSWICLGLLALLGLVQSGCTHGSKVRLGGGEGYAPVPLAHVALLLEPPKREFDEIGLVKASGAGLASRTSVYRKLQKSAADMGADAVIIRNESQCYRGSLPGSVSTTGSVSGQGYGGMYSGSYSGSTLYQPPTPLYGTDVVGIAIRYKN